VWLHIGDYEFACSRMVKVVYLWLVEDKTALIRNDLGQNMIKNM